MGRQKKQKQKQKQKRRRRRRRSFTPDIIQQSYADARRKRRK
jgi:hypothetical protein